MSLACLPDLSSAHDVSVEQVNQFQQNGHILLKGVVSPAEMIAYRLHIVDAVMNYDREEEILEQIAAGRKNGWRFVHNLWERDEVVRQFVLARRFAKIAADLMAVSAVRLLRDESYFKEPGGASTPWHQDCDFFPLDTPQVISMWIALSDISVEMAPLTFASGSHKDGYFVPEDNNILQGFSEQSLIKRGFELDNHGAMAAGDATFHAGWTLHSSGVNTSDRIREALVIVYYQDGAHVWMQQGSELNEKNYLQGCPKDIIRQQHLTRCLPGLKHGDLAASYKNPLVYTV
jgi:ectoine hydroxylase-related dioxygenase (phytanoyl-CoA dioxygenase family)